MKIIGQNKEIGIPKKTSTSGKAAMLKTSSMNKNKRKTHKRYRGQGR